MNAYLGHAAVGVTWPVPWRAFQKEFPKEAASMKVIWETPHLINNSFMVRNDVPLLVAEQIRTVLLHLHDNNEGRDILANMEIARFLPASNADYEVVRSYVARFEKEVRPVALK